MTKFELIITIAIVLFAMAAPLGLVVEGLTIKDLIITDRPMKKMINAVLVKKEEEFCLKRLFQGGLEYKCIEEVNLALVFGFMTDKTFGLQCCQNIVELDLAENRCWDLLFSRKGMIKIDMASLMEFCAQEVLAHVAPSPTPELRA